MSISYPPAGNQAVTGVTVSAATPGADGGSQMMPANPSRAAGTLIINNMSGPIAIRLDTTAVEASFVNPASIILAANGGAYDLPDGYKGPVQAVRTTGATGTVQIIEPHS